MITSVLIAIIVIALFFEFTNGFHDAANVVATPIATKSLTPYQAIGLAAFFNFLGAFFGTAVAATISKGLVDTSVVTDIVLISALLGAISWNLFTWSFGIPSSSSHALIGSLVGAVIISASYQDVNYVTVVHKVLIPMVSSPIMAFFLALIICIILLNIFMRFFMVRTTNKYIREMQVLSTSLLSFSHGSNDAQKTMSIITLALLSAGVVQTTQVPNWVIVLCGVAMGLGTLSGGKKIIKTLSAKLSKLEPVNAVSAELSSGILVLGASHIGLPVSTTQVASGSIMGAGYADAGVNWKVVKKMATAWVLTIPACIVVTSVIYTILFKIFGSF
ncbi:inorganic phosphate transporter [Francisella philomiragia]|uniref:Inorganic phosphate transporter (PiT) family protein n=1 Tax=Francisella philomiragia subsp. philomiragia (strain ATCC 25017 / CCUG 19701 / FSC 153 / O\|nr:inorganic phosphate transporter [Francisella philomiragia]AJI47046.1 phosphate transporter family protein [Francisella philomiragia]AJI48783.1 phosphate transporter family protein [Francisella philomiragia]MBK2020304.1 inorganic phosphate transporter [Francisella philomiragia]MBK2030004.1 inorganic phosphate transporter [Francisella philomiragia]MBK2263863.1 inorganic phosphate transporter [Francisella philomiragia]